MMKKEVAPYAVLSAIKQRFPNEFDSIMRAIEHDPTGDTWRATLNGERSISVHTDGTIQTTF